MEVKDSADQTPLFKAMYAQCPHIFRVLVENGRTDVNHTDYQGQTLFSVTAGQGHLDIVVFLLSLPKVEAHRQGNDIVDCKTLLAFTAEYGHKEVLKRVKRKNRLNVTHSHRDGQGTDALASAARRGHDEVMKRLLKH